MPRQTDPPRSPHSHARAPEVPRLSLATREKHRRHRHQVHHHRPAPGHRQPPQRMPGQVPQRPARHRHQRQARRPRHIQLGRPQQALIGPGPPTAARLAAGGSPDSGTGSPAHSAPAAAVSAAVGAESLKAFFRITLGSTAEFST